MAGIWKILQFALGKVHDQANARIDERDPENWFDEKIHLHKRWTDLSDHEDRDNGIKHQQNS